MYLALQPTIVTPTYNEAENLPKLVSALFALPVENLKILVVDDHSPDGTGQVADELAEKHPGRVRVLHRAGKLGLGTAYLAGFHQALEDGADAVVQMDADFSHSPDKVVQFLDVLQNCDVAVGSRYTKGGKLDERWPLWRRALSGFGNVYARSLLRIPMHDVTGGFRAWQARVLSCMPLDRIRSNGYAFQVEMAYVAHRLGFCFQEVPIYFADRRWGQSKMSLKIQIEAALRVWQMLYEYRDLSRKG